MEDVKRNYEECAGLVGISSGSRRETFDLRWNGVVQALQGLPGIDPSFMDRPLFSPARVCDAQPSSSRVDSPDPVGRHLDEEEEVPPPVARRPVQKPTFTHSARLGKVVWDAKWQCGDEVFPTVPLSPLENGGLLCYFNAALRLICATLVPLGVEPECRNDRKLSLWVALTDTVWRKAQTTGALSLRPFISELERLLIAKGVTRPFTGLREPGEAIRQLLMLFGGITYGGTKLRDPVVSPFRPVRLCQEPHESCSWEGRCRTETVHRVFHEFIPGDHVRPNWLLGGQSIERVHCGECGLEHRVLISKHWVDGPPDAFFAEFGGQEAVEGRPSIKHPIRTALTDQATGDTTEYRACGHVTLIRSGDEPNGHATAAIRVHEDHFIVYDDDRAPVVKKLPGGSTHVQDDASVVFYRAIGFKGAYPEWRAQEGAPADAEKAPVGSVNPDRRCYLIVVVQTLGRIEEFRRFITSDAEPTNQCKAIFTTIFAAMEAGAFADLTPLQALVGEPPFTDGSAHESFMKLCNELGEFATTLFGIQIESTLDGEHAGQTWENYMSCHVGSGPELIDALRDSLADAPTDRGIKGTRVSSWPIVLVVELCRQGNDRVKMDNKMHFQEYLVSSDIRDDLPEATYRLFSVIVHWQCHYFCFCFTGGKWWRFDDETVGQSSFAQVVFEASGDGREGSPSASMLWYLKQEQ
jgi:hypothetical protein